MKLKKFEQVYRQIIKECKSIKSSKKLIKESEYDQDFEDQEYSDNVSQVTIEQFRKALESVDVSELEQEDFNFVCIDIQGMQDMPVTQVYANKDGLYLTCENDKTEWTINKVIEFINKKFSSEDQKNLYIYVDNSGYDYPVDSVFENTVSVHSVDQ